MRPFQYIAILFAVLMLIVMYFVHIDEVGIWLPVAISVIYVALLVVGAARIQLNYFLYSHNSGDGEEKQIALTFDDGPAAYTGEILDILKEQRVKAAFFCIGQQVIANPIWTKRIDDEGHIIGNHSYLHSRGFDWKSSRGMLKEIEECNNAIRQVTGRRSKLFRPPYGVTNPNVYRAVKRSGMYSIGWSLRSFDTSINDKERLKHRVLSKIKAGDIILLHDSQGQTAEILTELIQTARKNGYTFVRLDQLLQINAYS